jgi:hypothetical protein
MNEAESIYIDYKKINLLITVHTIPVFSKNVFMQCGKVELTVILHFFTSKPESGFLIWGKECFLRKAKNHMHGYENKTQQKSYERI